MGVGHELLVCTEVKQPACGIVWASGKGIAIGKETYGIDVRLVSCKGLPAHPFSDIPELGWSITSTRDKQSGVRSKRQAHDISSVSSKCGCLLASLDVPQGCAGRPLQDTSLTSMPYVSFPMAMPLPLAQTMPHAGCLTSVQTRSSWPTPMTTLSVVSHLFPSPRVAASSLLGMMTSTVMSGMHSKLTEQVS